MLVPKLPKSNRHRNKSGLQYLHRSNPTTDQVCLSRVERGKYQQSWSNCKNCSAAGTRLSYLNCNSDLTITHWCCSSRSSRTWPLLIWQSSCHNSLPTVVIIFEKSVSRPCCKKKSSTLMSFFPRSIILWNSLPSDIQSSTSLPKFKAVLRAYLKV